MAEILQQSTEEIIYEQLKKTTKKSQQFYYKNINTNSKIFFLCMFWTVLKIPQESHDFKNVESLLDSLSGVVTQKQRKVTHLSLLLKFDKTYKIFHFHAEKSISSIPFYSTQLFFIKLNKVFKSKTYSQKLEILVWTSPPGQTSQIYWFLNFNIIQCKSPIMDNWITSNIHSYVYSQLWQNHNQPFCCMVMYIHSYLTIITFPFLHTCKPQ